MSAQPQPSLLDPTWPCPVCNRTGRDRDCPSKPCYFCRGPRDLDFDPNDLSEIPY